MNATYAAVVGQEPRETREVPVPAGVSVTREPRRRGRFTSGGGRVVPNNPEMVEWLDHSTPGWYSAMKSSMPNRPSRVLIFSSTADAALFKLFWT